MSRLIDADKLIEKIKKTYCERCDNYNGMRCKACPNDDEIRDIDSAPTIDAVSVVRCGECKLGGTEDCPMDEIDDEHFCNFGEREGE